MYKHILIATDGSQRSERAIADGVSLAVALGARVTFVTVTVPLHTTDPKPVAYIPGSEDFVREYLHGQANAILAAAENIAAEQGMTCDTARVNHDHPYQAIIETAEAKGCDLIVMASHGRRGVVALILGSETTKVLTHSHIPVLVHRS
jgi:nucleotide-binding universal stress UspA family protein